MHKVFSDDAWNDYLYWESQDKKTLKRINTLIKDMERDPFSGIGKPEPLKFGLSGCWSRRIDATNRLIYTIQDSNIWILSCKDHY
ncbi:Txe/YoeB family addiction module toxin [Adlercreutzia sp. ZJ304]|uniref:Txe/YoeB family addiction module toxin n=1 Tax=Adlercreutzia sp. ZJ304 TaxID=2709791 RepID=UPI0013E99EA2|nr:Txe/YoeB family addiction module toxin [Adlercreutzia sp. ZJ304]